MRWQGRVQKHTKYITLHVKRGTLLFSSIIFLSFFLPAVIIVYFILPARSRNLWLLISSLIFYAWSEKMLVLVMLLVIAVNYMCGILIEKGYRRQGLFISVSFSLAWLFYYKYANFTYENVVAVLSYLDPGRNFASLPQIVLPVGISFYVFQTMSYTVDVYRGNIKASRNCINFSAYVSMFPQLVAGPIIRYADIARQLETNRKADPVMISEGIERFITGLAKKVLIANTFAAVADTVFAQDTALIHPGVAWIGIVAYSFQIYFDFSAYSDMAIGLAKVFGFRFLENFNYPYISRSVKEFWRRWHISLSSWFRDYVYIPLGGSRKGTARTYINLLIVFFVTGLWHGASWNFIVWGLWHGLFLVVERIGFDRVLERLWRPVQHVYTLLVVCIGWVFFRAEDLQAALLYLRKMFFMSPETGTTVFYPDAFFSRETIVYFILAVCFCLPAFPFVRSRLETLFKQHKLWLAGYFGCLFVLFYIVMMHLSVDTYNPFIYFRF